ncbi:MAG TPA: ABC transporter permease [Kofleriaceae bacterium]
MLTDLRFRLRALFRRNVMERELDDELQFHLDRSIEAHMQAGQPREEATRLARLELGGVAAVKQDAREARGVQVLDDVAADVRYGVRVLRKAPAFTVVAVLTLALGIGANTAMFSLVNTVLLHPLPYAEADQLVRVHARTDAFPRGSISYPNFLDWQAMNHSFSALAVSRGGAFTLTGSGSAERVAADLVSADYFTVLGVQPIVGRAFAAGEDRPGAEPIVIIGERLWKRKLGAATSVVGTSVVLDGKSYRVLGVVPAGSDLRAVSGGNAPDLYVPIGQVNAPALERRSAGLGIHGIARLKPGVTIAQARADMAAVTKSLAGTYPDINKGRGATLVPLRESVVGNVRPYVYLLFGAVGLVLLISCVNVANLLLARAAGRSRELGIRLALGASFGRLVRQLLTESLLLAVAGGALGLLLAWWCTGTLFDVLPRGLPRVDQIALDARVLGFTAVVAVLAGVLAGLAPALKVARPNLHDSLKEGGRGPSTTRHRTQAAFVVLQVAMALVLLVSAGLLVRTLVRLSSADPGFEPDGMVSFGMSLSPALANADPATVRAELRRVDSALAAVPGVEAASRVWGAVPIEADDQGSFWRDGWPAPQGQQQMALALKFIVGPDHLTTMRTRLLRGRFLSARDDEHAPRVVVIDEVFAQTHFPGEDPIGKRLHIDDFEYEPAEIVGVVAHVKQWGLDRDERTSIRSQLYEAFQQLPDAAITRAPAGMFVLVRARTGASGVASLTTSLRTAVQALGAENVMYRVRSIDTIIASYQATRRFAMYVLAAFAALALLLSCVGIYGVVSYVVAQRTNEIGIRMALGAQAADIMRLVLRQGMKLALAGVVLGLAIAVAVTPLLEDFVYGVPAIDPVTFVAVACGVTLVALLAIVLPARRAMRMDPMQALRAE